MNTVSRILLLILAALSILAAPAVAGEEEAAIKKAVKAYLKKENPDVNATVVVQKVDGNYARTKVQAEGLDEATAYLKRKEGVWTVLVLGTGITDEDYVSLGIPKSVQE